MRVLVVGCGYVGQPLAVELAKQGHEVFGVCRTEASAARVSAADIQPLVADVTRASDLAALPHGWDWVVNCVSAGDPSPEGYHATYFRGTEILVNWLRGQEHPLARYVYTSSTGVYDQDDGSWVSENDRTADPASPTGRILAQTEDLLLDAWRQHRFPAVILRLAGIYGPGRGYWLRQFLSGEARLENRGGRFLNMVHREDVVGAAIAALQRSAPGEVYNVVDDEPATQYACFQWLAERLAKPMPVSEPTPAGQARRRTATNKRISNRKLREALGYTFTYPTFREGYAAELGRLHGSDT